MSLQELLRNYAHPEVPDPPGSGSRGTQQDNELFALLSPDAQALVSPYLKSNYTLMGISGIARRVIFSSDSGASFRRWLNTWLRQLIEHHASGMICGHLQAQKPAALHFNVYLLMTYDLRPALHLMHIALIASAKIICTSPLHLQMIAAMPSTCQQRNSPNLTMHVQVNGSRCSRHVQW